MQRTVGHVAEKQISRFFPSLQKKVSHEIARVTVPSDYLMFSFFYKSNENGICYMYLIQS